MGKFDLGNFPTSESAKKMLGYVSDGFYDESYVGKWLFQVMGVEYDKALEIAEELPAQFFPETATWGLTYHEIKWGLPVRTNLSYEERRRLIYQKRDYRAPMTPYRMEKYLEDVTGFEVHIADVNDPGEYGYSPPHPNVFEAYFLGEETLDSKLVHKILDRLKQSHTTYRINDRIEIELDNRNLERIMLRTIRFRILAPFWYEYVFDGRWFLDGGIALNVRKRYGLLLGVKLKQAGFYIRERITLILIGFAARIKNHELFRVRAADRFGINFWNVRCLDGSWNLDGSIMPDTKRNYGLSLCIGYRFNFCEDSERARLFVLYLGWNQHIREDIVAKTACRFEVDFWDISYLDGGWGLDGERPLNSNRSKAKSALATHLGLIFSGQETVANVFTETKTRDYWFMNGALRLDGARNLNSIYRREVLE